MKKLYVVALVLFSCLNSIATPAIPVTKLDRISAVKEVSSRSEGVVPVSFLGSSAALANNKVLVQWSATGERNTDWYEVERSEDGNNWRTIAYVGAIGNYDGVNEYSYNDKIPASGTAYYRIKQIGVDEKFAYATVSLMLTSQNRTTNAITVRANRTIAISVPPTANDNIAIQVVSMSGQTVYTKMMARPKGRIVMNDLQSLKGNYIIVVSDGKSFKVAKQVIL